MESRAPEKKRWPALLGIAIAAAVVAAGITALLVSIIQRKTEAKQQYVRLVEVTDDTVDPKVWGTNWPREYDSYLKTVEPSRDNFGGGDASPAQKADQFPWLTRIFAGYAFSLDYRDRRGHAYMLLDQEKTRRVTEKPQPGACLHCHASIIPAYRFVGKGDVMKGFEEVSAMTYQQAHALKDASGKSLVDHPVGCVDCHDPKTLNLRVSRPGFLVGIKALKEHQGVKDYDVNRDATPAGDAELRLWPVPRRVLLPRGPEDGDLSVEERAEGRRDRGVLRRRGELRGRQAVQGLGARRVGHAGAEGAAPGVRAVEPGGPLAERGGVRGLPHALRARGGGEGERPLGAEPAAEHRAARVRRAIRTPSRRSRRGWRRSRRGTTTCCSGRAGRSSEMLDTLKAAKAAGATDAQLGPARALHRKAQWRLDFVAAENSMGFHAPQETARLLGESIDYGRQAQLAVEKLRLEAAAKPAAGKGAAK